MHTAIHGSVMLPSPVLSFSVCLVTGVLSQGLAPPPEQPNQSRTTQVVVAVHTDRRGSFICQTGTPNNQEPHQEAITSLMAETL